MTTTLYALTIEQPRVLHGGLLVHVRCEECDEVHRLALDDEQLDAIRSLMTATLARRRARVGELLTPELVNAAADVIAALVWQLTHTTAHDELRRRDRREATP